MEFGLPSATSDQPSFFMPQTTTSVGNVLDDEGVPFDPAVTPTLSTLVKKQVKCAVEYVDGDGKVEAFAVIVPSKIKVTLLDQEYVQVQGFSFVVIKGQKYYYQRTEPPVALGTVDVYTVYCRAEDDG